MSDVKRLLDEATPLPWPMKEVIGGGPVSIDLQDAPNAALIVYAVNRLPDYEAAVEALEVIAADDELLDANEGAFNPHAARFMKEQARTALVRLREAVLA